MYGRVTGAVFPTHGPSTHRRLQDEQEPQKLHHHQAGTEGTLPGPPAHLLPPPFLEGHTRLQQVSLFAMWDHLGFLGLLL